MTTDWKLVVAAWTIAAVALLAVHAIDKWREAAHVIDTTPEHDWPLTREQLLAITRDRTQTELARFIAAAQLHENGWCSCADPYNQEDGK